MAKMHNANSINDLSEGSVVARETIWLAAYDSKEVIVSSDGMSRVTRFDQSSPEGGPRTQSARE